ncbi:hypothetical protein N431DRAFT_50790 [Stipitochalara longipes BDJ]|nr:hypothetical protein N431DRAFT_50790 [Stipitochalara longipes BDJ]
MLDAIVFSRGCWMLAAGCWLLAVAVQRCLPGAHLCACWPLKVLRLLTTCFSFAHLFCASRIDTLARPRPLRARLAPCPPSFLSGSKSPPKLDLSAIEAEKTLDAALLSSPLLPSPLFSNSPAAAFQFGRRQSGGASVFRSTLAR